MDKKPIRIFESPEFGRMRTSVGMNGEPLFCGKDVCEILGYKKADVAVRQHVNRNDVTKRYVMNPVVKQGREMGKGRRTLMLFVNEGGFYDLVFRSTLPIAKRFKRWVTMVVLPQIRKTGGYIPIDEGDSEEDVRKRTEEVLSATIREKDAAINEMNAKIAQQEAMLDKLYPDASYAKYVLKSVSCYTTTQIAKELGVTAQELNRWLCACHIQYYQSGQYLLYADFAHMGLAKSRTRVKLCGVLKNRTTHSYLVWTEKGRRFIHFYRKQFKE